MTPILRGRGGGVLAQRRLSRYGQALTLSGEGGALSASESVAAGPGAVLRDLARWTFHLELGGLREEGAASGDAAGRPAEGREQRP